MINHEPSGGNKVEIGTTDAAENVAASSRDLLSVVHRVAWNNTHVKTYFVRSPPDDILEGLKAETPPEISQQR